MCKENKKVKNATPNKVEGINFKSKLESRAYLTLKRMGITPDYEKYTYTFYPPVPLTRIAFYKRKKRRNQNIYDLVRFNTIDKISYTPDFTFELNGYFVIMEMKGMANDSYPIKRSLFRRYLEENFKDNTIYFELKTIGEVKEAISIVQNLNK